MYGLCTVVFLLSTGYANAATGFFPVEEKPAEFADEEGCYLKHLNKVIPYGDYYPEKSCSQYSCLTSNITHVFTCGAQYVDENGPCHLVSGDLEQNYPNCCPWVMCSTIPSDALTSQVASVTEQATQASATEAKETKPHEEGALNSDDAPVIPPLTQDLDTEVHRGTFAQEGPLAEILVAEASENQ